MTQATSVPANVTLPELTFRGVLLGALITIIFTASNVFLGLRVGLTFSSAIPAAVISMSVLRLFRDANILENNMVQTQASAAGTLSSIIFILPALVMMGHWQGFPFWQTLGICAAGGMLGVMFTIPLRHVMVVQSDLPYPEGVAAAEILRVGSAERIQDAQARDDASTAPKRADTGMGDIVVGSAVAAAVSFAASGLRVLGDSVSRWFSVGDAVFRLPMGFSLALLGAGYLIGIVAGLAMLTGLVIAWGIAVPILTSMGTMASGQSIEQYATSIWSSQVRFIGAGVIGVGAVWTLVTLFKPMVQGVKTSFSALSKKGLGRLAKTPRTELDLPGRWISIVTLVLVVILVVTFYMFLKGAPVSAAVVWKLVLYAVLFAFVFGFLVAAACGYMAGLVGSSTSPISGVGIVAIVLVSVLMLVLGGSLLGTKDGVQLAIALSIFTTAAVVAVASISNDNLQDLKTGWLVGATPWRQQVALLIGCVVGAAVIPPVLDLLYNAYGFADAMPHEGMDTSRALSAPQATLMLAITKGIFTHQLNWTMILIGMAVGVGLIVLDAILKKTCQIARMPVLAVGIGIYLPPTVAAPIVVGAVLAWILERSLRRRAQLRGEAYESFAEAANRRGVLIASGLIVGESLVGVLMAAVIVAADNDAPLVLVGPAFAPTADLLGLAVFALVAVLFWRRVMARAA